MAKVRIQARAGDVDASEGDCLPDGKTKVKKQAGALGLLLRVLRKEGFVGLYQVNITTLSLLIQPDSIQQGMSAQIIKAVLSQALLFVSKEQFEYWALSFMVLFAKITARS
jgi:adenine nucleotide transporter 17